MKKYTIYCTPEQTRKAIKLGAPIKECGYYYKQKIGCETISDTDLRIIPTAEQMRGWLMDKLCAKTFQTKHYSLRDIEGYGYLIIGKDCVIERAPVLNGRWLLCSDREATLAAIDAALEYLINNKK